MSPLEPGDSGLSDPAQVLRLRLKTPPRIPRFMYAVAILTAMTFISLWGGAAQAAGGSLLLLAVGAFGGILPLLLAINRDPPPTPVVELTFDRLRLPRTAELADTVELTYREIDALFLRPGRSGFLWIGAADASFMYPVHRFCQGGDAERLRNELQARISARLPDGDERVATFAEAAEASLVAYRRPLPASTALVLAILGGTILARMLRVENIFNLVHAGAFVPPLVLEHGQWWRLGTMAWLSMPADGLIASVTAGVFGIMVERLFGSVQVVVIAALSIGLGSALSLVSGEMVSFGATPVALGLFAAVAFAAHTRSKRMPVGFRPPGVWWIVTGVLLAMLALTLSDQSPSMLVGGALAGAVATAFRLREDDELPLMRSAPLWQWGLALAFIAGTGFAGLQGYASYRAKSPVERDIILEAARAQGWGHADTWNELARHVAIAESPTATNLATAGILSERAVSWTNEIAIEEYRKRQRSSYLDTLATVRFRQGRFDEAVDLERGILVAKPEPPELEVLYATQLARFLDGRVTAGTSTVTADLPPMQLVHNDSRGLGVTLDASVTSPTVVWGVVRDDGPTSSALIGLLRFSLDPGDPVGRPIWLSQRGTQPRWSGQVRLIPADAKPGVAEWTAWTVDPKFMRYPSSTVLGRE